jgi:hypothetical protein
MKKIILAVIAGTMLLSNVAFAADKNTNTTTIKNHVVSSASLIHLQVNNPHGW